MSRIILRFIFFVYLCKVIGQVTDESTELMAPRVEVVTLNYILTGYSFLLLVDEYGHRRGEEFVTVSRFVS